ncbi:hypothetical protein COW99_03605 [Candidatus Roizmanbacteria bacterium CG22_combo_CG10-13_8_21_14_all_38_20]|uniref:Soluble ligand binding domain-containing protein n=1 Tax=Candidatus Roizmanbacteria bacterium CG22_combo_CG10-13_8_21_14_all_38_20 TaxID=1974862 RepID=A0A2H0BX10_9BACT|nr:hypothetical protein [Candidatus Microgenomates bacterium]PIP61528.1 MAG: hypothetical protein COW99_03605 [Candidatus Roizmanbacteria bacterium CG22_combo_CG10-13_8_21_14_all_38_20]PJC31716.1 MAG: hypothetical protein CO050_02170 [Candidatus Roizmanbacteria bacterium CG_4_9_14_0_2_um_filter_38_17]
MQFEDIAQLLQKYRFPVGLVIVGLFLFSIGLAATLGRDKQSEVVFNTQEQLTPAQTTVKIVVIDIGGAVEKPGVYELPVGSRIKDIITEAGGFIKEADQEQISLSLNLAALLTDGQKIIVPFQGEEMEVGAAQTVPGASTDKLININNDSQSTLETLTGIGPVRAAEIIANRPYGEISELVSKKILGQSIYDKIKDQISVY